MELSLALAFAAGLISCLSPCVLALLPIYVAFLGEAAAAPLATGPGGALIARPVVFPQALLFVGGFTLVFVGLGTSIGLVGAPLFRIELVRQTAGVLVVIVGLAMTGLFGPVLERLRVGMPSASRLPAARNARSVALGALVGIGWTPCIGPVLGAILTMGLSSQQAGVAAALLLAYSAGLAVPFLAAAVGLPRLRPVIDLLRRHHRAVGIVAGGLTASIGVLIFANAFARMASLFSFFF